MAYAFVPPMAPRSRTWAARSCSSVEFHPAGVKRAWEFQAPEMQKERPATVVAAMDDAEITVNDNVDAGSRSPVKVAAPTQPTDKEFEEHKLTHLPFRNWCKECVQGRGMQASHFRVKKDDYQIKKFHMEFMFLRPKEVAGQTLACMVVRETETRTTMAASVQDNWHIHLGAHRGILTRDRVLARRHHRAVRSRARGHEHDRGSGKDPGPERWREIRCRKQSHCSSQSNGVAEKAIQSVQGQVRVLKLALEKRWSIQIPHRHSVIPCVVEHAAFLLNRYEAGHDGKTAYERWKGKRAKTLGIGLIVE